MYEQASYHSPDVQERQTSDGGFSSGWGMHFLPREKYWLDVHLHIGDNLRQPDGALPVLRRFRETVSPLGVRSAVMMLPMRGWKGQEDGQIDRAEVLCYLGGLQTDKSFRYMVYMDYRSPDPALVLKAAASGACGFKLFFPFVIVNGGDAKVFLSPAWRETFAAIEQTGLPVLFHVTQRLTDSPYTGGGRNSYWKEGWPKGVTYTNEDLLQIYLQIVADYPGIPFISAHQLHIGWERLCGLFDKYPNLYSDTTIGCIVRAFDRLREEDRAYLAEIFIRYADRLLFGTDAILTDVQSMGAYYENSANHIRFIKQLYLPDDALQKVAWQNFERLLGRPLMPEEE